MDSSEYSGIKQIKHTHITWAVVNNRIEYIYGDIDHKDWLKSRFGISQRQFEETVRGYISKQRDNKIDVTYFVGSGFDDCDIDTKLLAKVLLIADLSFPFDQINLYSGLKIKKNLETTKLRNAYKVLTKLDVSGKVVSVKSILDYEDKLVNIINSTVYSDTSIFRYELDMCHKALKNYINQEHDLLNHDFKRRLITYNDLL